MSLPTFTSGPLTSAALNAALQAAVATAQANMAPASGSPNYAPASGSPNYAPATGSPNYAPATGSPNYAPAGNYATNPMTSSGDLIVGGTNGAPTRLPAGANGLVLSLASGTPAWVQAPRFSNLVSFSAGASGNWTVPVGITLVKATLLGGGGGGSSSGGGGGGAYIVAMIPVTPGSSMSYSVGSGGAAQAAGTGTTFAGYTAGGGGFSATVAAATGGSVTLGTSGTAWSLPGQPSTYSDTYSSASRGGGSPLGLGGSYYASPLGLGAGSACANGNSARQAGTGGILILEY